MSFISYYSSKRAKERATLIAIKESIFKGWSGLFYSKKSISTPDQGRATVMPRSQTNHFSEYFK